MRREDNYEPPWDGVIATRDTGTERNWIDHRVVERFGLQVTRGLIEQWTTFNGQTLTSCETVRPTWCLSGGQKSYKVEFLVVTGCDPPFDVLFGRSFLNKYPDILSSKNAQQASPLQVLVQKKPKV
jgi:hypothetical protein